MLAASSADAQCSFPDSARPATGSNDGVAVNIKHTFIELIATPRKARRQRSFTDTELLSAIDETLISELSDASTGAPSDEEDPSAKVNHLLTSGSPYWGPSEDHFYANTNDKPLLMPALADEAMADQFVLSGFPMGIDYGWGAIHDHRLAWPEHWSYEPYAPDHHSTVYEQSASRRRVPTVPTTAAKTTVMLRNLQSHYVRSDVIELLEDEGFEGSFDLVYVPMNFVEKCCLGYAFVNFLTASDAQRCWHTFTGYSEWSASGGAACEVVWSDPHQGLDALVERYRNSPVMHKSVQEEWKPAHFVDGVQVPFPAPTEVIKAPKQKTSRGKANRS